MRDINARINSRSPRGIDGRGIVVHDRVGVKRHPFLESREAPVEIEARVTFSRIISRKLFRDRDIAEARKAMPKRTKRQRHMTFTGKNDDTGKSEFQVTRRFKTEFLCLHPRFVGIYPTLKIAQESLVTKGPRKFGKKRNVEGSTRLMRKA